MFAVTLPPHVTFEPDPAGHVLHSIQPTTLKVTGSIIRISSAELNTTTLSVLVEGNLKKNHLFVLNPFSLSLSLNVESVIRPLSQINPPNL